MKCQKGERHSQRIHNAQPWWGDGNGLDECLPEQQSGPPSSSSYGRTWIIQKVGSDDDVRRGGPVAQGRPSVLPLESPAAAASLIIGAHCCTVGLEVPAAVVDCVCVAVGAGHSLGPDAREADANYARAAAELEAAAPWNPCEHRSKGAHQQPL